MSKQSFRKIAANLFILIALSVCLFFVSSPQRAWAVLWQSRQKTITKYEHPSMPLRFGKVKAAGKLLELKAGPETRETRESREEFDADDDWMKDMTVSFTNTSDKNIVFIQMLLIFPETESAGPPLAFPMTYGRMPKDSGDRNFDNVLKSGEEVELALTDEKYNKLRDWLKNKSFEKVSSVRLFLQEAVFDDDMMWTGGSLARRDPKDPNNWIHIQ